MQAERILPDIVFSFEAPSLEMLFDPPAPSSVIEVVVIPASSGSPSEWVAGAADILGDLLRMFLRDPSKPRAEPGQSREASEPHLPDGPTHDLAATAGHLS